MPPEATSLNNTTPMLSLSGRCWMKDSATDLATWIGLPSYILMCMTPVFLRIKRPELKGPFRIPGGWPGLLLCAIPPFAISVYLMVMVSPREMLLGLPFFAVGPLLYVWARRSHRLGGAAEGAQKLD